MVVLPEEYHDSHYTISPCGLYCKACPSFGRTCKGCSSDDRKQKRTSKWSCSIRVCCKEEHCFDFCSQCSEAANCNILKKLAGSHPKDKRFFYRHIIPENLKKMNEYGLEEYIIYQDELWRCPECGGTVAFYYYYCLGCGKSQDPEFFPTSV